MILGVKGDGHRFNCMLVPVIRSEKGRIGPSSIRREWMCIGLLLAGVLLSSCRPGDTGSLFNSAANTPKIDATNTRTLKTTAAPSRTAAKITQPPPTLTALPTKEPTKQIASTPTPSPSPEATPTPSRTPTSTPIGPCAERLPGDGLLALVDRKYGLSREFEPSDLVPLSDYFSVGVTKGYPTEVREVIIDQLVAMIDAMIEEGLHPSIISGYRDYSAQAIARAKWLEKEPDRVGIISAPPGHSEHQLGTTVDFGSPELALIVGDESIEFHTYFYKTSEGQWLEENAHSFGFTLSYPLETFELTGLYYEPWHYRFIGVDIATELENQGMSLIEYLLENEP